MNKRQESRSIPVRHEGRTSRIRVAIAATAGTLAIGSVVGYNVLASQEDKPYNGPLHTIEEDGRKVVEGIVVTEKGDDLTKIAEGVNEFAGVNDPSSDAAISQTREYLRFTGGGMNEEGQTIPIQSANDLPVGEEIHVYNFVVDENGDPQLSLLDK